MIEILELMMRLEALKRTARTGWNLQFPPGNARQSRSVPDAESVADHSWSLAMFAFAVGEKLGLDTKKLVKMALIHDIAECVTGDIVTATLSPEEKRRAEREKHEIEGVAMLDLFFAHGDFGAECYALWIEYETQASEEARVLADLDKLECVMQSVCYAEQGHTSRPEQFTKFGRERIRHPGILEMLAALEARTQRT